MRISRYMWLALVLVTPLVLGGAGASAQRSSSSIGDVEIHRESAPLCETDEDVRFAFQPIPVVDLPESFRSADWESVDIGRCALRVDSSGEDAKRGFVTHGEASGSGDASFDVVFANSREFYVAVRDDEFVLEADKWLHEDHLEIWTAPERETVKTDEAPKACVRQEGSPNQWALLFDDERVVKGEGDLDDEIDMEVERTTEDGAIEELRLKGRLPEEAGPLVTVVYSDSDDGEDQERLIATSDLEYGDGMTLGALAESSARCEIDNGELLARAESPSSEAQSASESSDSKSNDEVEVPKEALAEICGGADSVEGQKCLGCPDYTANSGVYDDAFRPVVREIKLEGRPAYLASWGSASCVPGVGGNRGIALVRKSVDGWERADYIHMVSVDDCRTIETPNARPRLLCESAFVRQGHMTGRVDVLRVEPDELERNTLLVLTDSSAAMCRESVDKHTLERVGEVSYDAEHHTIEVEATALHVQLPEKHETDLCSNLHDAESLPDPKRYQLEFSYEEDAFQIPEGRFDADGDDLKDIPVHDVPSDSEK